MILSGYLFMASILGDMASKSGDTASILGEMASKSVDMASIFGAMCQAKEEIR